MQVFVNYLGIPEDPATVVAWLSGCLSAKAWDFR